MDFVIKNNNSDNSVKLSAHQILDILLAEVLDNKKEDIAVLGNMLISLLEERHSLGELNPVQLAVTSMATGFYYKKLLEKNDVTFVTNKSASTEEENASNTDSLT